MPEYPCYCGKRFFLPLKYHKSLVDGVELFCSVDCFLAYLRTFSFGKHLKNTGLIAPCVAEVKELYDPVTRNWYRSWYEIHVARCLKEMEISFAYEQWGIQINNMQYTPDFWLSDLHMFIEVKGAWAMSSKTKYRGALDQGYSMILLPWHLSNRFRKRYRLDSESETVVR